MSPNTDYSQRSKLLKINDPILFFSMQLDTPGNVINSLNQGRLSLWSFQYGYLGRWVATSSYDSKQNVGDWESTGGIHPPNYSMGDAEWFWLELPIIIQPGQAVDEGYILYYKKSNNWTTLKGNNRSQVMAHPDKNWQRSPGSYGCIVMKPEEWKDFRATIEACCGHLKSIRYGVIYTFQP